MYGSVKHQINSLLEGFYEIVPKKIVSIFTGAELEIIIAGVPKIDIQDLKSNVKLNYNQY